MQICPRQMIEDRLWLANFNNEQTEIMKKQEALRAEEEKLKAMNENNQRERERFVELATK